jgi:hypothetical protein
MKFSLITLALLGHIEAESLEHHYRHLQMVQEDPVAGKSRLVNMTDADIKAMNAKTEWSTLNYGPYEQKEFPWSKVKDTSIKGLSQLRQPVYWNDEVDRSRGYTPVEPKRDIPYGYGDSAGQHTGTLAQQKRLYVPAAGITLV